MCACTAQPPAVTRERRCHPGDRADKSEVRHDRPTPTDLNGSLPRRAAQGSPSPHAAGATPVNEEGPQETPKPSGPLAGRLLGGTGAGQRSAPPHGLPHPVAKVGPSFRAPGVCGEGPARPMPSPRPSPRRAHTFIEEHGGHLSHFHSVCDFKEVWRPASFCGANGQEGEAVCSRGNARGRR